LILIAANLILSPSNLHFSAKTIFRDPAKQRSTG
jgi:hypothetical protein